MFSRYVRKEVFVSSAHFGVEVVENFENKKFFEIFC
jgi:hypothetical protein